MIVSHAHKLMFVGKQVRVQNVVQSHSVLSGMIEKETKHTFSVRTQKGTLIVPKKGNLFIVDAVTIKGEDILSRHEDRLKV